MRIMQALALAVVGVAQTLLSSEPVGTVVAWGASSATNVPAGLFNAVAISTGEQHSMVLKGDGTVVLWGANNYGQTDVPAGLSNVVAIDAGNFYSMVLKPDGTVQAWGQNHTGQSDMPAGLSNVKAIAAGGIAWY
jgi:alpha-tubulin suppressor-like RCC1 family protein